MIALNRDHNASGRKHDHRGQGAWMLLVLLGLTPAPTATAAEAQDAPETPLNIEVRELSINESRSLGSLRRFTGRLSVNLRITARNPVGVTIDAGQLKLLCDQRECRPVASAADQLLSESQKLENGEQIDRWVSFAVNEESATEPELRLIWSVNDVSLEVDINQALRDLINLREDRIGPRSVLAVLSIERTIDLLTIWVLSERLKALKADGIERVVVDARLRRSVELRSDVTAWLNSARMNSEGIRRPGMIRDTAPVQFTEFHVSGFRNPDRSTDPSLHVDREQAVAAALDSVYRRISQAEAVEGLQSPHAGVRRAALSASIDRLTPDQLAAVLNLARSPDRKRQELVLEYLDRVAGPSAVHLLQELLLEYLQPADLRQSPTLSPPNAVVAVRTLVRCIAPGTKSAMNAVWRAAARDPEIRSQMMDEILRIEDHRWVAMASDFAVSQLDRLSAGADAPSAAGVDDPSPDDSPPSPNRERPVVQHPILPSVLRFLHLHDPAFSELARSRLLSVPDPRSQDVLLTMVRQSERPGDRQLATACIRQRLSDGTVTSELLGAIRDMPSPEWTARLLELHDEHGKVKYNRAPVLIAALRCATDAQLDDICDAFLSFNRSGRTLLLQHFMALEHPRSLELFQLALENQDTFSTALRMIPQNAAPEMLQLLLNRLEPLRQQALAAGELDSRSTGTARELLAQVGVFDHPEARRMVNLWRISPVPELRLEATEQTRRNRNRSRVRRQLEELWESRREPDHDDDESLREVTRLIEQDPFFADSFLLRASLHLRADRVELALTDILEADKLNPADVTTESTVALIRVRTGELADGIREAESVLERVPGDAQPMRWWTLYNTACVYGRAIEQSGVTADQQLQFHSRAIELLTAAANDGLDDEQHVRNDPDLAPLRHHPDWNRILLQVADNEARQR